MFVLPRLELLNMEKLINFDFIFFVDEKAFANWISHPCPHKCK